MLVVRLAAASIRQRPSGHYPISVGRVRHVTVEAVAAVIAATPAQAVDAAAAVEVDWQPLPAVGDMQAAIAADAPKLFDHLESNVDHVKSRVHGDVDAAFANAHRVVKQRMHNQRAWRVSLWRAVLWQAILIP